VRSLLLRRTTTVATAPPELPGGKALVSLTPTCSQAADTDHTEAHAAKQDFSLAHTPTSERNAAIIASSMVLAQAEKTSLA